MLNLFTQLNKKQNLDFCEKNPTKSEKSPKSSLKIGRTLFQENAATYPADLGCIQADRTVLLDLQVKNLSTSITLFPNPVKSEFYLDLSRLVDKKGSIQIYNAYGQKVQQFPPKIFSNALEKIDASQLENGFYYLTIHAENASLISKRFVVESYK